MSSISSVFKQDGRKALVAYITTGYPSVESTVDAAATLAEAGCDLIELGIPFSDPLADGVTIQNASHQALLNGITVEKCLETAARIRRNVTIPLVFMGYLNPALHYGTEKFCADSAAAGVDGFIIPDLPPGELPALDESARSYGLDIISFLAPNSSDQRIQQIADKAGGFIYLVSVTGVTGVRQGLPPGLREFISRVRRATALPLCVGFGISTPQQAREAAVLADGVIIGSRIIQLMETSAKPYPELRDFVSETRRAMDRRA